MSSVPIAEFTSDQNIWYVIRTKPRQEDRAASNLITLGIKALVPKYKEQHFKQFTGELVKVVKPLFPSYIFACFKLAALFHKIRYTRGVHSIISFGHKPAPVDDEVIRMIEARMCGDGLVKLGEQYKYGDELIIKDGPLKNFTGIFEWEMKDSDRIMILLNTVNYQAHYEIQRDLIQRLN